MSPARKYNETKKYCPRCENWKYHSEFYKCKSGSAGLEDECKECGKNRRAEFYKNNPDVIKKRNQAWVVANPEKVRAKALRYRIRAVYGLTPEQYQKMWEDQNGQCAFPSCGKPIEVVDHDHKTGITRGLLCHTCNLAIGHFQDNVNLMAEAIAYLNLERIRA